MVTGQWIDAPEEGGLDAVSVPQLLAQAWRDERSGTLQLAHGQRERHLLVRKGAPCMASSPRGEDDFAAYLSSMGRIDDTQRVEVERLASERGCPQASAVLALQLIDAKALYLAMRAETRMRIADTLTWAAGQYRWIAAPPADSDPRTARAFDLLALLQDELPRRWGIDRLFDSIRSIEGLHGDVPPRHRKVAAKLAQKGEMAARAIAGLDGHHPLGRILGDCAGDPLAAATLWTAAFSGVMRRIDAPRTQAESNFDFEVDVEVAPKPSASLAGAAGKAAGRSKQAQTAPNPKADALREEIQTLLQRLGDLDHYKALGLEGDASGAHIKKAYFKAAKKYHPDALGRLGLESLKDDAAQVFARIAEAFEVLSDPDKKKAYDAGGSDEAEIDTARLAQAETSFRKGEILAKMGNFEGALDYFEPAVELWPDEPAYQMGLGWALFKQPRPDHARAIHHLGKACGQAPNDAVAHYRLGLVFRTVGETHRANPLIAKAQSLDPDVSE